MIYIVYCVFYTYILVNIFPSLDVGQGQGAEKPDGIFPNKSSAATVHKPSAHLNLPGISNNLFLGNGAKTWAGGSFGHKVLTNTPVSKKVTHIQMLLVSDGQICANRSFAFCIVAWPDGTCQSCFTWIFSTALAVLFTLVDSGIDVCMYYPEIALTVLNC